MSENRNFCLFAEPINTKRVLWEVTNTCNLTCKHCCTSAIPGSDPSELTTKEVERALREMREFGVTEVAFSGGEPFARRDFLHVLRTADSLGMSISIATNGTLLSQKALATLRDLNIRKIHVSLDSHVKVDFNFFRGNNLYDRVLAGIGALRDFGIYVRVGTVVWSRNLSQIHELAQFLCERSVDELILAKLISVGRLADHRQLEVDEEAFDAFVRRDFRDLQRQYAGKLKISLNRSDTFVDSGKLCIGGNVMFHVDSKGRLAPCSWSKKMANDYTTVATLRNRSFGQLVADQRIQNWNSMVASRHAEYGAGCPAVCKQAHGRFESRDPQLIARAPTG